MSDDPKGESRSYVVGLPVLVTVWDDGTVVYDLDTAEAGEAILDDPDQPDEDTLQADMGRINADHDRRNGHGQ